MGAPVEARPSGALGTGHQRDTKAFHHFGQRCSPAMQPSGGREETETLWRLPTVAQGANFIRFILTQRNLLSIYSALWEEERKVTSLRWAQKPHLGPLLLAGGISPAPRHAVPGPCEEGALSFSPTPGSGEGESCRAQLMVPVGRSHTGCCTVVSAGRMRGGVFGLGKLSPCSPTDLGASSRLPDDPSWFPPVPVPLPAHRVDQRPGEAGVVQSGGAAAEEKSETASEMWVRARDMSPASVPRPQRPRGGGCRGMH